MIIATHTNPDKHLTALVFTAQCRYHITLRDDLTMQLIPAAAISDLTSEADANTQAAGLVLLYEPDTTTLAVPCSVTVPPERVPPPLTTMSPNRPSVDLTAPTQLP